MNTEKIKEKYHHYGLEKEDVFKHQHYLIITRSGIDKIQAIENIIINCINSISCENKLNIKIIQNNFIFLTNFLTQLLTKLKTK